MRLFSGFVAACMLLLSQAYAADTTDIMPPPPAAVQQQAAPAAAPLLIVAFGDSIFSGYKIAPEQAFPARLEKTLLERGYPIKVIPLAIPGDTTAGGLARINDALKLRPTIVVLELGGNDLLRAIPPETVKANLDNMLFQFQKEGIWVVLAGMRAPLNYGRDYAEKFNRIYTDLAAKYDVPVHPSIMDGVIGKPEMMQSDGIHPNPLGVDVIVQGVAPLIQQILMKR